MAADIPKNLVDLLERPIVGHLGTVRPDGAPQVNPMWFLYDGEDIRFTHTTKRAKYRNLQSNPAMSLCVSDPDDPYRYIEVRGRLNEAIPDPKGEFFQVLGSWYGNPDAPPPPDAADRVILVMSVDSFTQK
ncbi:PPOX class F420-dependent oxidoreductase [Okibacterium endophyticum]